LVDSQLRNPLIPVEKDDLGRLEFYIRDLKESIELFNSDANNKKDIKATVSVWKTDIAVAYSLIRELTRD